jgi:hypothetical protein
MDQLGNECRVQYRWGNQGETVLHGGGKTTSMVEPIRRHFAAAGKSGDFDVVV